MLWATMTILAALSQSLRTAVQKHLTQHVSTNAVNWVRYSFGLPVVCVYLGVLLIIKDSTIPSINNAFMAFTLMAALAQMVGSGLLITLFGRYHICKNRSDSNCLARGVVV